MPTRSGALIASVLLTVAGIYFYALNTPLAIVFVIAGVVATICSFLRLTGGWRTK